MSKALCIAAAAWLAAGAAWAQLGWDAMPPADAVLAVTFDSMCGLDGARGIFPSNGVGFAFTTSGELLGQGGGGYTRYASRPEYSFCSGTNDQPFSVSFWLYMFSLNVNAGYVSKANTPNPPNEWIVISRAGNAIGLLCYGDGPRAVGNYIQRTSVSSFTSNRWWHMAFTYPGGSRTAGMTGATLTVNATNAALGAIDQGGTYTSMVATTQDLYVGTTQGTGGYAINGLMDDVVIFNRVISRSEILELYQAGKAKGR